MHYSRLQCLLIRKERENNKSFLSLHLINTHTNNSVDIWKNKVIKTDS